MDSGWSSKSQDFFTLTKIGEECIHRVLTDELISGLAERTKYLTLGIDLRNSEDVKVERKRIRRRSAELVAVLRLTRKKFTIEAWTGKSYPTVAQEHSLVHVVDLDSHWVEIDGLRVLVLGCHDLNMFSPRAWANQNEGSPRRKRCRKMRRIAKKFDPTIVIQHPHQTDSSRIWQTAWSGVRKTLTTVKQGLSGIAYLPGYGCQSEREGLSVVLERTKFGPQIEDVAIKGFR